MESCIVVGSAVESKLLDKEREDMDPSRAQMHFMLARENVRREVQGEKQERIRTRKTIVLSSIQENRYWSLFVVGIVRPLMNLVHSISVW